MGELQGKQSDLTLTQPEIRLQSTSAIHVTRSEWIRIQQIHKHCQATHTKVICHVEQFQP